MTLALEILDAVIDELPIDPSRIYVTGRSMGGFGTWDAIARRPDLFAAAIPIAGGGDSARAKDWVDLPIWTIASDGDKTCPVSGTRVVVEALKQAGGNITYTEHPTKSHGEICQAWADIPELHDWLFAQRK
jgi:predicted peptidase